MNFKKLSIAVAALAVSFSASAQWAVYDANVYRGVQAIVDAVRGNGQANSQIQSKVAESVATSMAATSAVEAKRQAERDYLIVDACGMVVGAANQDSGRVNSPTAANIGRGGSRYRGGGQDRTPANMRKALEIANGQREAPSPEDQATLAIDGSCSTFADKDSIRGVACTNAGKTASNVFGFEKDVDLKASTVFYGAQKAGVPQRKMLTITDDKNAGEMVALDAYLRNLNTPISLRKLEASELKSELGRQYMVFSNAYEARQSMAEHPIKNFISDRMANKATIEGVEQHLNSPVMAGFTQRYLSANGLAEWKTRGISRDELLTLEVESRYKNQEWIEGIASTRGDPLMKQLLLMQAHDKVMTLRLINQLSEMSVVMGQMASTLNRMEMTPQLNALHAAATRGK